MNLPHMITPATGAIAAITGDQTYGLDVDPTRKPPGVAVTLFTSAARVDAGSPFTGTAVDVGDSVEEGIFILKYTAAATEAGDTCDVYIDGSLDNVTYFNLAHFQQQVGNVAVAIQVAILGPGAGGAVDTFAITADLAVTKTRACFIPRYLRGRAVLVETTGDNCSFTFSLTGVVK